MKIKITFFAVALFFVPLLVSAMAMIPPPTTLPPFWSIGYSLGGNHIYEGNMISLSLGETNQATYSFSAMPNNSVYADLYQGTLHSAILVNHHELLSQSGTFDETFPTAGNYFATIYEDSSACGRTCILNWFETSVWDTIWSAPNNWGILNFTVSKKNNRTNFDERDRNGKRRNT